MTCNEAQTIIDGYLDRELDLVTSLEMEHHLETCDGCSQIYKNRQTVQASFRAGGLVYPIPAYLPDRVLAAVRQADRAEATPARASFQTHPARSLRWGQFAAAASFVVVALLGWGVGHYTPRPSSPELSENRTAQDQLTQEVFASDMRSLMAVNQGIEVRSESRHTVKPWFAGKLDFSPPVQDFAAQGWPLAGGRRDYVNGRPVAVLVYKHQAHWANVFLWPSPGDAPTERDTRQGYAMVHWAKSGMAYWAVSDAGPNEMEELVRLLQSQP